MKRIAVFMIFSFLLISCGNKEKSVEDVIDEGNLSEIRSKKAELSEQQSELSSKIDKLDEAIKELDPNRNLTLVTTTKVTDALFKHYAEVQGDVATDQNIIIYPEFSGVLEQVKVEEGEHVQRGQTLAVIDDGGLESQLAQLQAQETLAQTTFERQKRLWEQNIGSEMQYLQAKTNYESVKNSVDQLKSQLAKTVVTAPFSGIIDEVISDQGQVVNPGQNQLFRLVSLDNMYIDADVPETYLNSIEKGTDVKVQIGSIGKEFHGKVSQVGNTINPGNRTFNVRISIPNSKGLVKPNQIATIKLNDYSAKNAVVIPENVVQQNARGESLIYVIGEKTSDSTGFAQKTVVETGRVYNDSIEVKSGLEPGQTLILEGGKGLRDGQEVEIRN
ncbi:MAG: efflux RND transporter periplasmic adaptor subunit [Salegentibacter sp.]